MKAEEEERTDSQNTTGMIVTHGATVRIITAAMMLATIIVDRLTASTIGALRVAEMATMKTGAVVTKSAATTPGTTMSATMTAK